MIDPLMYDERREMPRRSCKSISDYIPTNFRSRTRKPSLEIFVPSETRLYLRRKLANGKCIKVRDSFLEEKE